MFRHLSRIPMASFHGRPRQMRRTCFPLLFKVALFSSLLAAVFGSLSSSSGQNPPSPPRNLRWSVVGAMMDSHREYRVFWSVSKYTGGLPVNYSVKLCVNDSYEEHNGTCQWSSNPDCRPVHVLSTKKDFFCVLQAQDFVSPCEKTCNYIISVVAVNDVGSATSWRYLPFIPSYSATPFPPLSFSVNTTGKVRELRVSWTARKPWKYLHTEYTILYHAKNQMENETKVIKNKTEFILLTHLEDFVKYYVYLMVRFVSKKGVRSAPSEVKGPRIMKTPAGQPDTPSKVLQDQSAIYPDDPALRDVTVEWELADNASWRGTPGKYIVKCSHHLRSLGSLPNCEYHLKATIARNRTVLRRLNSSSKYNVYITKCNQEGKCSTSEAYIVKELRANVASPKNKAKLSSKQIAWITVSVVVGCITALGAVYFIRKWRRGEMRELFVVPILSERIVIPPPDPDDYECADSFPVINYDTLLPNENQV